MDCAGGTLISTKKLERVFNNMKGNCSSVKNTDDVKKALPSGMSEEAGQIVVCDVLGHAFLEGLALFFHSYGTENGGCKVFVQVRADRWLVRKGKILGFVCLLSLLPFRYESVQTAFVRKTHAVAILFSLLQATELSREWQREIVVVHLDVEKAFHHVDHRAAFKAMR